VLDGVHIFQTGRLGESLKVIYQWLCLVLEATFGGPDVLLVGAILFLVVILVAGSNRNLPRVPLSLLFAALHGALDDKVGWPRSATAGDHFPVAWGKDSPDRLLVSGILASDVKQLLGDVPDDFIRCPEAWWESYIAHAPPRHLWPLSLWTKAMSLPVAVCTPA
jgi:hypothetical protein